MFKRSHFYRFVSLLMATLMLGCFTVTTVAVDEENSSVTPPITTQYAPTTDITTEFSAAVPPETPIEPNTANDTSMTLIFRSYLTNTNTEQIYTLSTANTYSLNSNETLGTVQISPAVLAESIAPNDNSASSRSLNTVWTDSDLNVYPYSFVTFISFSNKEKINGTWCDSTGLTGTGYMIGPNVMLTAAHNLYNHEAQHYSTNITIHIKRQDTANTENSVTTAQPVSAFIDKRYITTGSEDYDWALVFLNTDVFPYTGGYFGLGTSPNSLTNRAISIAAYRKYVISANQGIVLQKHISGTITYSSSRTIEYDIETHPGNSGAPIYDSAFIAWGIHTFHDSDILSSDDYGGTRFTALMYQFFCEKVAYSKNLLGY